MAKQTRKPRKGVILTRPTVSQHWKTRGLRQHGKSKHIIVVFSAELGGREFKLQSSKKFDYKHPRDAAVEYRILLNQVWENHLELQSDAAFRVDYERHLKKANDILSNFDQNEHKIIQDIRQNKLGEEINDDDAETTDEVLALPIDIENLGSKSFESLSWNDKTFRASIQELFWETNLNRRNGFSEDTNLVELCKPWDRNKGRTFLERWQAKPLKAYDAYTVKRIFDIMSGMSMLQTIKPAPYQTKTYSAVVVQGSALFRACSRLDYVRQHICKDHTVAQIYVCTSDRKLDPNLESAEEIERVSNKAPHRKVTTEFKMLQHLWDNLFKPEYPHIPVQFIEATTEKNMPRPGSLETAQKWYRVMRRTEKIDEIHASGNPILAVTNQPFLNNWFTILSNIVPVSIQVEAGGPAASTSYFKHNVSIFLDAVYRYVKEAHLHDMF